MRFLAISLCALAILPAASGAQQSAQLAPQGPTIQAAAVGFRVNEAKVDASKNMTSAPVVARHAGQDVALMVVGGAAIIVGAIIGSTAGTIVMIGGAAAFLLGLFHYLE